MTPPSSKKKSAKKAAKKKVAKKKVAKKATAKKTTAKKAPVKKATTKKATPKKAVAAKTGKPVISDDERRMMITMHAYYKWENAGFPSGQDWLHWLEAENEVDDLLK